MGFCLCFSWVLCYAFTDARMTIDSRVAVISSYLNSLSLTEGGDQFGSQIPVNDQDLKPRDLPSMEICGTSGPHVMEMREELRHNQDCVDPTARSTLMGSSCATTMSVHSGPTCHPCSFGRTDWISNSSVICCRELLRCFGTYPPRSLRTHDEGRL